MAENPKICSICDGRNISKPSTDWCTECEQSFCAECKDFHSLARSSQNHITLPIQDFLLLSPTISTISSICTEHNERYQMFCQIHDELVCPMCIENHIQCKDIIPLGKKIQNVKSSCCFQETVQSIVDIDENIAQIQEELQKNVESLQEEKASKLAEISQIRKKINNHLDQIEQKIIQEITEAEKNTREEVQAKITYLQEVKTKNSKSQKCLDDLNKYASDLQAFFGLRLVSSEVIASESDLKNFIETQFVKVSLKCCIDKTIIYIPSNIPKLGLVQIQKVPREHTIVRKKDRQAQLVGTVIKTIDDITIKPLQKINTKGLGIRGCVILPGGEIVLSDDWANKERLIGFDASAMEVFEIIMKDCYAVDITCIDSKTVAVTTSKFGLKTNKSLDAKRVQGINIVDIKTRKIVKFIPINNKCHGITYHNGSVLCSVVEIGVQQVNIESAKTTTVIKKSLPVWTYITFFQDKIYYSNGETGTITCKNLEGNTVWRIKNEKVLKNPLGISVDNFGNVYVASASESSVVVLSPDGQQSRKLLSAKDGLNNPRALCYDRVRNRLIVANKQDTAYIFGVST